MSSPTGIGEPDGWLHVFYKDTNTKDLRHAERRAGACFFEILDGAGGTPTAFWKDAAMPSVRG